jgi:hypothetical protein
MLKKHVLKAIPVAALAVLPHVQLWAQDTSDDWQWRATIYGWLPDLEAKTEFPSGAGGPTITVDASTLVDNLDFTFQAGLQVRKGAWGVFTDVIYMDEGAARTGVRDITVGPGALPSGASYDLDYDMKSWVWTLAGTYGLASSDRGSVDVLFGARMLDIAQDLAWMAQGNIGPIEPPARAGSASVSLTNWDAVVGFKGLSRLGTGGRWILPWYVDIGAGDSDFTVQALAGLGYAFGWGEVLAAWRYLDYDLAGSNPVSDLNFNGPMVGASFDW